MIFFSIFRNTRSIKGRDRENRLSPNFGNCQCGNSDENGHCDTNKCGYNSEDEYINVSNQCNDLEWIEVITNTVLYLPIT